MRRWRLGLTLIELLVAMVLSALLLSLVLGIFVGGGRWFHWASARTDLGASAILGLNGLSLELRNSAYATLTIASTTTPGPAMAFGLEDPSLPMYGGPFTPASYLVVYYLDTPHQALMRKVWPGPSQACPAPPMPPPVSRISAADLQTIVSTPNGTERAVATGIVHFTVVPADFPTPTQVNGIQISLDIKKSVNSSQSVEDGLVTTVYPRNAPSQP